MTGESSQASLGDVSIGQLAEITGVPVKTIRYYSDEGLLPPRRRTAARYRRYGAADRVRLEQIRALRELGFGLDAIRRLLARGSDPAAVVAAQVAAIDRELTHLRHERFWDLVAIIRRRPPPPHARAMRLVFAALAPDQSTRGGFRA